MTSGALVSVKLNVPLVEVIISGNGTQPMSGGRLVVHPTWNWSLVGADHRKVTLVVVTVVLVMAGNGATKTVNVLLAVKGGTLPSLTTVVNRAALPAGTALVQVMTPLLLIEAPAGELVRIYFKTALVLESVAVLVTITVVETLTTRLLCTGSTGALFVGKDVAKPINRNR